MKPWNNWIPGVLSNGQLHDLLKGDFIIGTSGRSRELRAGIDASAFDLYLTDEGYEMRQGSVKPYGSDYKEVLDDPRLARRLRNEHGDIFHLKRAHTYVFKLSERLVGFNDAEIYGQATAKSTIGRVDVLARLIVDGMDSYEEFTPKGLRRGSGFMYVEISPITFHVRVKSGTAVSQLRLFYGSPEHAKINGRELHERVLHYADEPDGSLSVDLTPAEISEGNTGCAYCAHKRRRDNTPINLWGKDHTNPRRYWEVCQPDESGRLSITSGYFYILRSKEVISLPAEIAVYCRAIDETIGEMRIHYAGFVHPFFGEKRPDGKPGTPLIFEVRGHDVDVSLRHGEKMAKLTFYRMSENPTPPGPEVEDPYQIQSLQLSKLFKKWPNGRN